MPEAHSIRFSVVCAAYNAQATVVRAISSCFDQTHPPYEVIIVDDGSTDGTADVLQDNFGDRIRLIKLDKNAGPSAARNSGIIAATGDFIALQDADDCWEPVKLSRVADVLTKHPEFGFVFHQYAHKPTPIIQSTAKKISSWSLLLRNIVATPCAVFRKVPGLLFDERLRWMEDWDFFLRLEQHWGAWLLTEPLTVLGRPVLAAGGQSAARWKMRRAEMRVYAKWASARWWRLLLLPLLWVWSATKGMVKWLKLN